MEEALNDLKAYICDALDGKIDTSSIDFGEITLGVSAGNLISILRFLRDDVQTQFISIIDICGVDYPGRKKRFEVVYHLLSPRQNMRVRLKLSTDVDTPVPSATDIYPGANWFEREAYDMYGILFTGHPDLRRLLTDYGFEGYPLRKDFPLTGYSEVRYDDELKRVVYEPVELRQEFRDFRFPFPLGGNRLCASR